MVKIKGEKLVNSSNFGNEFGPKGLGKGKELDEIYRWTRTCPSGSVRSGASGCESQSQQAQMEARNVYVQSGLE